MPLANDKYYGSKLSVYGIREIKTQTSHKYDSLFVSEILVLLYYIHLHVLLNSIILCMCIGILAFQAATGSVRYAPEKNAIIWTIKTFPVS